MGIKSLFQVINENAPDAIKTGEIKNQFGRKVAIVGFHFLARNSRLTNTCRMRTFLITSKYIPI